MKKITFAFTLLLLAATVVSQNRKGALQLTSAAVHELYVSFDAKLNVADANQIATLVPGIESVQQEYGFALEKGISISEAKLLEMETNAAKFSGSSDAVQRLRNIFKVRIQNPDNQMLLALAKQLETFDAVTYCCLVSPEPVKPPGDILPVTDNFEMQQGYLNANPGVNMRYAWNLGLTGTGIKVRDVEYGVNQEHEEFNDRPGNFLAPGMDISSSASTLYTEHGTATFGVVYGDKGSYGVSGMAHNAAEMILFPEWQESGYDRINAVTQAVNSSVVGDILIYEMQTASDGAGLNYVPAEYNNVVWDLTKAATDSGIIIVAAAGNGNQNLDSAFYASYMSRGNSGAIIVGAGTSNTIHAKMNFSTYGARVDVQGWGTNVISSGYGDWLAVGSDFNQNYTMFSGTSSATPIVASCAIVLQSYYQSLTGNYLTPAQMRNILVDTGIPQGAGGHIGPLPNMEPAIAMVAALAVKNFEALQFVVFPNPANDQLTIVGNQLSAAAKVSIVNSLGQLMYAGNIPANHTLDIQNLTSGIYYVKLSDNGSTAVKKIIKN